MKNGVSYDLLANVRYYYTECLNSIKLEAHLFKVVWFACPPPGFAEIMTIQQHSLDLYESNYSVVL